MGPHARGLWRPVRVGGEALPTLRRPTSLLSLASCPVSVAKSWYLVVDRWLLVRLYSLEMCRYLLWF